MLAALRNATSGWVAKILIGLLVMSFAVWGVADIFGGYGQGTVASVGGTEISAADYQSEFQRELRSLGNRLGRNITVEDATKLGLNTQVLMRLIGDAAIETQAKSLGLSITSTAITARLTREAAFKDQSGNFSREIFYRLLRANGFSEQGFLASQHRAMILDQLSDTVSASPQVSRVMLDAANRFRNETRTLRYITVPLARLGEIGEPSAETQREYYNSHKNEFRAPEFRKIGMISLTPDVLMKKVPVSDADIKLYYENNEARFSTPERRAVLQIPFPDEATANAAYEKLKNGAGFMEIAKARGLEKDDVELGLITRDGVPDDAVADVVFALRVNEISKPIKGGLAHVVAKVTKIESELVKTLEGEREKIRKILAAERAAEDILDAYDKIEDERAGGATLAEIARKLTLDYSEIAAINRRGQDMDAKPVAEFANRRGVLAAAFQADVGLDTAPEETADRGYIWFEVLQVTPQRLKPFDEARNDISGKWRETEIRALLSKKGQELVDKLRAGERLGELAKTFGLEVMESKALKRNDADKDLSRAAVQQAFALKQGDLGSATASNGKGRVIFQVAETAPPGALVADERKQLERAIISQLGDDMMVQYILALREEFGVDINQGVLDNATSGRAYRGRGTSSY